MGDRRWQVFFRLFDHAVMFGGNEEMIHERFDEFTNILSHLSEKSDKVIQQTDWVEHLFDQVPPALAKEYDRYMKYA